MNKAELIDALTTKMGTDRRQATAAVENVVDTIVRAVHEGDSVTITGFGVFEQRRRAARVARNPRTGETVKVKPTSVPAFRPGAQFKAIVSGAQKLAAEGPAVKRGVTAGPAKRAAKKAPAKKTAANKTVANKTAANRTAANKTTAAAKKSAPAKKSTAAAKKTAPANKTTTAAARKSAPAKKSTAAAKKTAPAKKSATKAPAKKAAAKAPTKKATAAKKTATKAPARKAPAKKGRK